MDIIQIASQFYVIRRESDNRVTIVDGPYPEKSWAAAMARTRDTE